MILGLLGETTRELAAFIGNICGMCCRSVEAALELSKTFKADPKDFLTREAIEAAYAGNDKPIRILLLRMYLAAAERAVQVLTDALDRLEREEVPG